MSTDPSVVRSRPVQTSAGKVPLLLKNEYTYLQQHLYDYWASNEVAAHRPPSQKVKVSALKAALAEHDAKLEVIKGKLKVLMKNFKEEQKRVDMHAHKEGD